MLTSTELTLFNNKNSLLPSPDRTFQKKSSRNIPISSPFGHKKSPRSPKNKGFVSNCKLFKLLGGEIYLAVSWYTFVCFIIHILHNFSFSLSRPKFLEPKWSHQKSKSLLTFLNFIFFYKHTNRPLGII